jgi:hypothetical protein
MTLIKSISGIRGTIGGYPGENLTPLDIVKFTAAYATYIKETSQTEKPMIVVGRDARISGEMVHRIITGTLIGMGCDVTNIGMATTPTTEIAVTKEKAAGGIIITASHNPKQWNALKLLDNNGEFLSAEDGEKVLSYADNSEFSFAEVGNLGKIFQKQYLHEHIQSILSLDLVDTEAIKAANFRVALDSINSVGGVAIPELLYALGVKEIFKLHCAPHGNFSHNPEPLPQNLTELASLTKSSKANVGFAVDPDVDRLAIYCENGEPFGEEYTLAANTKVTGFYHHSDSLFKMGLKAVEDIYHPRSLAYSILGLTHHSLVHGENEVIELLKKKAEQLFSTFDKTIDNEWLWHDEKVSYGNSRVPQAMIFSGWYLKDEKMALRGLKILDWLIEKQFRGNIFSPIGNNGWLTPENKAQFDQQPLEANGMIDACLQAESYTGDDKYGSYALKALAWFTGDNDINVPVYDFSTGGSHDGVMANGINMNEGAESTISWLMSLQNISLYLRETKKINL